MLKAKNTNSKLVYSTDVGRIHQDDEKPTDEVVKNDGFVRISRAVKGRRGKAVCVIQGLALTPAELAVLATELKKVTGTGGAVKDNTIEIQGDKREQLQTLLTNKGYKVKLAGG